MATLWKPPVELSSREEKIVERCAERRVLVFLRELRHRIFDDEMQPKTVQLARETGGFSATPPRAAFVASPLRGAA